MNNKERERLKRYGNIVCDFVNTEEGYDKCLVLIKAVQQTFGFSEGFMERAREALPKPAKLQPIKSEAEVTLLSRLCLQSDAYDSVQSELNTRFPGLQLSVKECDPSQQLLCVYRVNDWNKENSDPAELVHVSDKRLDSMITVKRLPYWWAETSKAEKHLTSSQRSKVREVHNKYGDI